MNFDDVPTVRAISLCDIATPSEGILVRRPGDYPFDPELDNPPPRLLIASEESIGDYQRLIANPFLAVLVWVIALAMILDFRGLIHLPPALPRFPRLLVLLAGLGVLFGPCLLFQYHCLDCGGTGWLLGHRRHICPAVAERLRQRVFSRQFLGLGLKNQLVGWLYVLIGAAVQFSILYSMHR